MASPRFAPIIDPQSSVCSTDERENGQPHESVTDSLAVLSYLSQEVAARMGKDFLGKMPLDIMERFCMTTVERDDPTAELLYKLVVNFMIAYSKADTSEEALKAFDFLDYLSEK